MSIEATPFWKPRRTAQALNLVLEDVRRSPRETLRARRDRINRQKEARLAAAQGPTETEQAEFDKANCGDRFE